MSDTIHHSPGRPSSFTDLAAQMSAAQSNRIGSLQSWIAAAGPMTVVERDQLRAVITAHAEKVLR